MVEHSGASSERLLAAYEAEYELDGTQREALALAGHHLDTADRLDEAVREHGVMIPGSSGQLVVSPAVAEARHHRAAAWTVLRQFQSDDAGAPGVDAASLGQSDAGQAARSPASIRASRAAQARWMRARSVAESADG